MEAEEADAGEVTDTGGVVADAKEEEGTESVPVAVAGRERGVDSVRRCAPGDSSWAPAALAAAAGLFGLAAGAAVAGFFAVGESTLGAWTLTVLVFVFSSTRTGGG